MNSTVEGGEGIQSHVLENIVGKPQVHWKLTTFSGSRLQQAVYRDGEVVP
jgi:hypothetical protein